MHGISREPFFRTLTGTGHTLGAAFHPGGFRPFLGRSVGALVRHGEPAGDLLGLDDRPVAAQVLGDVGRPGDGRRRWRPTSSRSARSPTRSSPRCGRWSRRRSGTASLTRAEQLADLAATSLRSLQRLFTDYVGVGPKWVIARSSGSSTPRRPRTAASRSTGRRSPTELGFTDQAHLTRAFTSVVGTPPATYRREA